MLKASALMLGAMLASSVASDIGLFVSPALAQEKAQKPVEGTEEDMLIFRTGKILTGKIISENDKTIRFKGMIQGIPFETDYDRSEILEVKRAAVKTDQKTAKDAKPAAAAAKADVKDASKTAKDEKEKTPAPSETEGKQRYYWIDLKGRFGQDITQTPIRDAIDNAKAQQADVLVFHLDAAPVGDSLDFAGDAKVELEHQFDELMRAEEIMPILVDEISTEWENPPRIVFWVKRAMAGAAFLPLVSKEIYFHPEGRLGGIGNLSTMMRGNERVVEKQISLRLQHAAGWANVGGYPEVLVRAMAREEFVLSYKIEDGRPVYFERLPESPDEELLTDSGKDAFADTIDAAARNTGNDSLTLDAALAQKLLVSKGTVETKDDLLIALGLDREGVDVSDKSKKITEGWSERLGRARRDVARLMEEFQGIEVQDPAGYRERTAARSARINKLRQLKTVLETFMEAWDPEYLSRVGVPLGNGGKPDISALDTQIKRIQTEQQLDKK
ncbi:MAG TPA: hypothetical protein VD971_07495 [Phycisphaerales bacterium]|nr:hypothetical protein [Phycisphaerales bacterium]